MAMALSLHIGLNHVDPKAYSGWDGALRGCINDATDLRALAEKLGYTPSTLIDDQATAAGVTAALQHAASELKGGDALLLTYSGHGGQVPDTNGDEATADAGEIGERADTYDETWVLYDRMLVDDELYAVLGGFAPGVRVTVLSDSCHSGTVTRAALDRQPSGDDWISRRIPLDVEEATYRAHQADYDAIQARVVPRSSAEIAAAVVLISGCQDNQTSADGRRNGLFTQSLLSVWNGTGTDSESTTGTGTATAPFKGTLKKLWSEVGRRMPSEQSPNYYRIGAADRSFDRSPALRPPS
jgi:hypothetical protein